MFAIISDIHGNLEALDAVLADITRRSVSAIYCLGDIVGYGPNPVECIERATKWDLVLLGNHDQAVALKPDGFGKSAERAVNWTRQLLISTQRHDLQTFLAERPERHRDTDNLYVHGSPRFPTHEYLFPEDVRNQPKMAKIAALLDRRCFTGHTHVPGVFVESFGGNGSWLFVTPNEIDNVWRFDKRKTIVNVGSVGQPRDKDWRACYAIVDGPEVRFHRVEYDVEATIARVRAIPELDNFLGNRLREGR